MRAQLSLLRMRDHAEMLAAASQRLYEERPRRDSKAGAEVFPAAALVMRALAIEVGMKGLIARARGFTTVRELTGYVGGGMQGHDLEHLFRRLPPRSQRSIVRRITSARPQSWRYLSIARGEGIDDWVNFYAARRSQPRSFPDELKQLGKSFVDWRYGYEHDFLVCNVTFLELLLDATLGAVREAIKAGKRFVEKTPNPT